MKTIKERVTSLSEQIELLQAWIVGIQKECPHPKFVHGLSMIGCIQPVLICDDCGFAKPMPLEAASNDFNSGVQWEVRNDADPR